MEITKQDVVNNGWLTDVAIASDNKITLDSEILKAHITHPDVYNLLYTKPEPKPEPKTVNEPEIIEELGEPVADDPVETVS